MNLGRSSERTADEPPTGESTSTADESSSWLGRARAKYGLGGMLVAVGLVLLVFPEPITSTVGVALVVIGAIAWIAG